LSRKITLNEFLVFEPDKKRITGRGRPVIIGASASLCLELLIENVGQVVTHQQFYDYVWRRFGTEPASTSLYQNISALRRALNKAGLKEDIIRTMPRKGFLLSPQTTIFKESIHASASVKEMTGTVLSELSVDDKESSDAGAPGTVETHQEEIKPPKPANNHWSGFYLKSRIFIANLSSRKIKVLTALVTFMFFSVAYIAFKRIAHDDGNTLFSYITNYKGCELFSKTDAFLTVPDVMKKVDLLDIDCTTRPYVYLTAYKNADRLSYFSCQHALDSGKRANCRSFYYVKNFNDE